MIELLNIEEFAETKAGGTPSTKVPEYWENGNIPWLNSGALNQGIVKSTSKFITKLGLEKSSAKLMPPDTVLIALTGATTGVAGYLTFEACANQSVVGILPSKRHFPKYLYYYLILIRQKVLKDASGAAQPGVNQKYVKNIQIPIPPLDEQKRIVAILDKCFEAIDKARANVEKNLQNAKELFQSRKNDLFKKLEEDLSKVPLPSVCDEIFAGGDAPKDNYSKEKTETFNIPIIANAVKDNGLYGYTNKIRVSKSSITIAARGSGTGHTEIRYEPFFPIVRLIVIIPNDEKVKLEYLKYSIQNFDIMRSGSAIPQLTVPMIKDYSLPLPSISEQNEIVKQLDELKTQTQSLESNYQQELNALDELKKSILQKAFNGEL